MVNKLQVSTVKPKSIYFLCFEKMGAANGKRHSSTILCHTAFILVLTESSTY